MILASSCLYLQTRTAQIYRVQLHLSRAGVRSIHSLHALSSIRGWHGVNLASGYLQQVAKLNTAYMQYSELRTNTNTIQFLSKAQILCSMCMTYIHQAEGTFAGE